MPAGPDGTVLLPAQADQGRAGGVAPEDHNEIARVRVRYGYKRIYVLLRREGWLVNHKWVYRIYCEEGLNLRAKRPKRRVSAAHRERKPPALGANEHWSMDFVTDSLCNGRRFRCLTAVDNYSRECLAIEVGQHNRGEGVVHVMSRITAERGVPRSIHVDNGPEFTAKAVRKWLARLVLSCCRPTACHCCCTVLPALASLSPIFRRVGGLC